MSNGTLGRVDRILVAVALGLATATAHAGDGDPIDLAHAARLFDQARALGERDGGTLWGVALHGPIIFADPMTRALVANGPDAEGRLVERDGVFVGTLPDEENMANTALEWAGVHWTMLLWPLPEHRYRRGRLLVHEMFHRIQDDLGLPARDSPNPHLDSRDGRIWMRLEWRALSEALIRSGPARREAAADALVFRYHRRSIFPDTAAAEIALELNEGLAEYTGFRAGGLPPSVHADRAAVQLDEYETRPSFVRNFAYASGPAYGILLDEAGATWRGGLTPASDLGALLAAALSIDLPEALAEESLRRAGRYEGGLVIDEETRRDDDRHRRRAEYTARFLDGPTLSLPRVDNIRYSFNPNAVEALPDAGTVYLTTRVTDAWGVLEVESGGALMVREGGLVDRFVVPAPTSVEDRVAAGDGWTLELAPGWRLAPGDRAGDVVAAPDE